MPQGPTLAPPCLCCQRKLCGRVGPGDDTESHSIRSISPIQRGAAKPREGPGGQSGSDVARRLDRRVEALLQIEQPEYVCHPRPAHLHGPAVESSPIASLNRKGAIWLRPGLRAGVRYLRGEGLLRHGSVTELTIDTTG